MMDWTDRHCRYFHRLLTRHTLLYTEMVNAGGILYGGTERHLRYNAEEHPVALQLGGNEPEKLAQAALKMARKLRNEHPTPKTHTDCVSNLQEEIADVELCISILPAALYDPAEVGSTMTAKHRRWNERLHDEKLWEVDSHED